MKQTVVVYDFETSGKNANRCFPTSLSAVAFDLRGLKIIEKSEFNSLIKPPTEEEIKKFNLEPITDEVLKMTHLQLEDLNKAPSIKNVWEQFCQYLRGFMNGKSKFGAPHAAGYNIAYDAKIVRRICCGHKVNDKQLWGFGPWDDEFDEFPLFHPWPLDGLNLAFYWWKQTNMRDKINMDANREFLGMDTSMAHNSLVDCNQTADMLIRFFKLARSISPKVKWNNAT